LELQYDVEAGGVLAYVDTVLLSGIVHHQMKRAVTVRIVLLSEPV
jgi:hypothetical protein